MRIKVKKAFFDKHSGDLHKVGEEFDVYPKRLDEINSVSADLVEVIEDEELKEEPKEEPTEEKPKSKRTSKKATENK